MTSPDRRAFLGGNRLRYGVVSATMSGLALTACSSGNSDKFAPAPPEPKPQCDIKIAPATSWERQQHILKVAGVSLRISGTAQSVEYDFYGDNFHEDAIRRKPTDTVYHSYNEQPGVTSYTVQARAHVKTGHDSEDVPCQPYIYDMK